MILYNLFPLLAGPFCRWGEHFSRAAAMGFDWVFVNPIQQVGASRSLYSIADYFRVNAAFLDAQSTASPEEQTRQMLLEARAAGLKVMIDLVINHCAIDSRLTREHPDWFVRGPDGEIVNSSLRCGLPGFAEILAPPDPRNQIAPSSHSLPCRDAWLLGRSNQRHGQRGI